jgi:hypothetical protein
MGSIVLIRRPADSNNKIELAENFDDCLLNSPALNRLIIAEIGGCFLTFDTVFWFLNLAE